MTGELRAAIGELPGVDQHAHLLSGPEAEWSLPDLLSESGDAGQRQEMRHHPSFLRAQADLAGALGVAEDEEELAETRRAGGLRRPRPPPVRRLSPERSLR